MSSSNGVAQIDWLDKTQIYAALTLCDGLEEASAALLEAGVDISPARLRYYAHNGNGRRQRMEQSGKAGQILGRHGRHLERVKYMDRLTRWVENQLMALVDPEKLDRERAAVLHRYREIMELLCKYDGPAGEGTDQRSADSETETDRQVQEGLSLLELISDGQPPEEVFDQLISDAARRVAAASGTTFPPPEPYQPSLA